MTDYKALVERLRGWELWAMRCGQQESGDSWSPNPMDDLREAADAIGEMEAQVALLTEALDEIRDVARLRSHLDSDVWMPGSVWKRIAAITTPARAKAAAEIIAAARRIAGLKAENREENADLAAEYGRLIGDLIVAVRRLDEADD